MYRIKQFVKAITAKVTIEDIKFLDKYLNRDEKNLVFKLADYDIKHSINVARSIEKYISLNKLENEPCNEYVKMGLLHDIGKIYKNLNPIGKGILVIIDKITKGNIRRYTKNKSIYIYYNHGEEGYKILKDKGYSDEFLDVVRYHHNKCINGEKIDILRKFDNEN